MATVRVLSLLNGLQYEAATTDTLTLGTIGTGVWNGTIIIPQYGGTGLGSLTPYALLAGGTTSTGNLQQLGLPASSGLTLVSNNPGILPTWQTSASGSVSSVSNSDSSLTISPTSGAVVASLNLAHANIWTALQTINLVGLTTTITDGFLLENTTAATAGVTVQNSPSLHFNGSGWNTSSLAANSVDFRIYNKPASSAGPVGTLIIQSSFNGGAYANIFQLNGGTGVLSVNGISSILVPGSVIEGVSMGLGSDATGDIYYGNASNVLTRLPIGTTGQILTTASGLPSWSSTVAPIIITAGTTSNAPIKFTAGGASLLSAAAQGAMEVDSNGLLYYTNDTTAGEGIIHAPQEFRLTSNGSTISTIANFFGTNSNPVLVSGAEYEIEIECYYTNTTSGTVTWTFTNSAAPSNQNIYAKFSPVGGIVAPAGSAAATYLEGNIQGNSTAAEALTTTGTLTTATTQYAYFKIRMINGTGTSLKIQATKLVGGTITPLKGSFWRCTRLPAANVGIFAA